MHYCETLATAGVPQERLRKGNQETSRDVAASREPLAALTEQEHRILELIGEGLTNREIDERMFLAEKTVKNYVSNVLAKLGLQRRTQVAVLATEVRQSGAAGS